jgi:hypothetical protein
MNSKATLFGNSVYNDTVVNTGERNCSFGKTVTLGMQKQTSTQSQRSMQGYETNQLFASKPKSELESNNPRNSYSSAKGKLNSKDVKLTQESSVAHQQFIRSKQTQLSNKSKSNIMSNWKHETTLVTPKSANTAKNQTNAYQKTETTWAKNKE